MADYIKREPRTFTEIADDLNDLVSELNDKIVELVKSQSADVAPVRRGRWAETVTDGFLFVSCSACGFKTGRIDYNYCPNCGARMDGEEE